MRECSVKLVSSKKKLAPAPKKMNGSDSCIHCAILQLVSIARWDCRCQVAWDTATGTNGITITVPSLESLGSPAESKRETAGGPQA